MIEKTCRCGKTKKNFNVDIGPFFISDCCTEAGYNHLGERFEPEQLGINPEALKSSLDLASQLQIVDDVVDTDDVEEEIDQTESVTEKAAPKESDEADIHIPEIRKKRPYNRNGQIKK